MSDLSRQKHGFSNRADRLSLAGLSKLMMGVLKMNRLNDVYSRHSDASPHEFIDRILSELGITAELNEKDLKRVPEKGGAIVVANHPLGGIDGLLLVKLLSAVRPDIKVMANFLLPSAEVLDDYFISINPFETAKRLEERFKGIRQARKHVESGGLLCVFPAGRVSYYDLKTNTIRDKEWQPSVLRFIKSLELPVVPVCFSGSNAALFHLLGLVNPKLKLSKTPSQFFSAKDRNIKLRVGSPISYDEQLEFENIYEYGRYLRTRTYLLGKPITIKPFFRPKLFKKKSQDIGIESDKAAIQREIDNLNGTDALLYQTKEYQVFWAHSEDIPNVLYEIGRLREITFREVGEGTGKNIDLDEYDLYYRHLFIWDLENAKIVGAYRLGMGKEIIDRYGKRGFYINSLFKLKSGFVNILSESIELGRSFVVKEYQLKPLSLYLLWKGILYFILKNPTYRYLVGPVTISGEFSNYSKFMITSFVKAHHFDDQLAELVQPRKEYIPKIVKEDTDPESISKIAKEDLKRLDKMIDEIEMGNFRLPALLKKYLGQNAKIVAFNVDPHFNDALDGLLVMDMYNVPLATIEGLSKEMNDKEILRNFPGNKPMA